MILKRVPLSDTSLHMKFTGKLGRTDVFKDEPYAFEHWKRQQTWKRYMEPFDCWQVVANVFWPVLWVATVAVALGLYKIYGQERRGFPYFQENSNAVEYGIPFTTTSFAVALLLVFRTNESYRRWWDARRNIGRLCTSMRNLVRMAMAWFSDGVLVDAMARWAIVLPHMMLFHVCEGHDMTTILKDMLLPPELEFLLEQDRPTFGVVCCMSYIVSAAKLPYELQQSMDNEIRASLQEFGASDDILRQPLPSAYTRHTSRFLLIWLMCLPIAIWQVYGWATPVISAAVAFFLLGIENIGIQIEEPFSVLPLDKIAHRLRLDIAEMVEQLHAGKALVESAHTMEHMITPPQQPDMDGGLCSTPSVSIPIVQPTANNLRDLVTKSAFATARSNSLATEAPDSPTASLGALSFKTHGTTHERRPSGLPSSRSLHLDGDRRLSKTLAPDTFFRRPDSASFSSRKSCNV